MASGKKRQNSVSRMARLRASTSEGDSGFLLLSSIPIKPALASRPVTAITELMTAHGVLSPSMEHLSIMASMLSAVINCVQKGECPSPPVKDSLLPVWLLLLTVEEEEDVPLFPIVDLCAEDVPTAT
ncbi:hypothetical protein NHX12_002227 [Muraenolepis orangiensis]|uniref:Uncharacterized protein n=1 Tax=Muraenolepis orangiensis TaxID=630683 RepID=A0A9Q0IF89_9TELE|nr:hypothetical protein NHX12_002227 [Muraenolepis orangiensis]